MLQVSWMRNGIVYSRERRIRVGTSASGRFLCTAVNVVGAALNASLAVEIKGEKGLYSQGYLGKNIILKEDIFALFFYQTWLPVFFRDVKERGINQNENYFPGFFLRNHI